MDKKIYYVYRVDVGGVCFYIGMGKGSRINHCLSGMSHNYALNELYFSTKLGKSKEDIACYKVQSGLSRDDAAELEKFLIVQYLPKANKSLKGAIVEECTYNGLGLSKVIDDPDFKRYINSKITVLKSTSVNRLEYPITEYNYDKHKHFIIRCFESAIVRTRVAGVNTAISCVKRHEQKLKGKGFRQKYSLKYMDRADHKRTGKELTLGLIPYYVTCWSSVKSNKFIPEHYDKDQLNLYLSLEFFMFLIEQGADKIDILITSNELKDIVNDWLSK